MILNQEGNTNDFNKDYSADFMNDGWLNIKLYQPFDNQRVLAVGDVEFEVSGAPKEKRRISLCRYNAEQKKFYIADSEIYVAESTNVMWWKVVQF